MGDILGALELLEAQACDGTNLQVHCPDEGDVIPQADEADVCDTERPAGGLVEPVSEEGDAEMAGAEGADEGGDDAESLEEEFNALFESADEDEDEDEDEEDEDSEEDSEDEEDEEDSEDDEDEEECDEDDCKKESVSILDWFA